MQACNAVIKKIKVFWHILALWFVLSFSANADEMIQGEKAQWKSYWHGIGNAQPDAYELPRAGSTIARALDAAKGGNFPLFCTYFWDVESNRPPVQVKAWFDEWKLCSQQYIYLIAQEAVLGNSEQSTSNVYAAVSIAPAALRGAQVITNEPPLRAQVIFARESVGVWKLLPDVLDQKIERALLVRASAVLYQPHRNFTKEGIEEQSRKINRDFLEQMRKNGASPELILSQRERDQVSESGVFIDHWTVWTNYYKAVILDPPVVFEMRDPYRMNFTNDPVSAFRSYCRAQFTGDARTLLKYADTSGKKYLKSNLGVDEAIKKTTYVRPNFMTHTTVLLTATTTVDSKDYALVFWRAQNERNPTNGIIALQTTIFVRKKDANGDTYLLSQDLGSSEFENIGVAAHATG